MVPPAMVYLTIVTLVAAASAATCPRRWRLPTAAAGAAMLCAAAYLIMNVDPITRGRSLVFNAAAAALAEVQPSLGPSVLRARRDSVVDGAEYQSLLAAYDSVSAARAASR